jgi:HEPN domain-containing protein
VEKYFKSLLVELGQSFPRTHDLVALSDLCLNAGIVMPVEMAALEQLNAYSVQVRYPGVRLTLEEAQEAVKIMRLLRRFFRKHMGLAK